MTDRLTIAEEDLNTRLDKLLSQKFNTYSRSYFQRLIDEGHVLLNGLPVKKQTRPELGDQLEITFQQPPILDVVPEDIPLEILYEDNAIIAINKPAGMVVHPAPGAYSGTFANALMHHCQLDAASFESLRPGIVHRLDKDTSGVLIAAKTVEAHAKLSAQFSNRTTEKTYLAICSGRPPEGRFSAPIARHKFKRKQMCVAENGREAISDFKVLAYKDSLSLVEVHLITGRTHQIRVHLKQLNCPILGDQTYGSDQINRKYGLTEQILHAYKLEISHPLSGAALELIAPIPLQLKNFIELIESN